MYQRRLVDVQGGWTNGPLATFSKLPAPLDLTDAQKKAEIWARVKQWLATAPFERVQSIVRGGDFLYEVPSGAMWPKSPLSELEFQTNRYIRDKRYNKKSGPSSCKMCSGTSRVLIDTLSVTYRL